MKENSQTPLPKQIAQLLMSKDRELTHFSKIIWLLARRLGPGSATVVDMRDLDRFWQLMMDPVKGQEGKMFAISALAFPTPPEEKIREAADFLRGTTKPLEEAFTAFELTGFPPTIVCTMLSDYISKQGDTWIDAALAVLAEKPPPNVRPNQNQKSGEGGPGPCPDA